MKKVIKPIRNFYPINFEIDGDRYVNIYYKRKKVENLIRMRVGNVFRLKIKRKIIVPKGMTVISINNNTPRIGQVTINLQKKYKKRSYKKRRKY